jgi:Tfp pilus assembly protein FimT
MKKHLKKPVQTTRRIPPLKLTTVLVVAAILAIAAVTVVSRQRASANVASPADKSLQVAGKSNFIQVKVAGQDVEVDSQTGKIRPLTPEEAQKLAAGLKDMVNQSTEGLEQVQHADGSVSMDLKGRFQNVTVARVNQDGSISQSCVDNPQAAGAFFGIDPKLIENPDTKPTNNQPNPVPVERQQ